MNLQEISTEAISQIYEELESARNVWNITIAESAREMGRNVLFAEDKIVVKIMAVFSYSFLIRNLICK